MDANQMVEGAFQELEQGLECTLEGLTPEELTWRPNEDANSINFLFWHISRAEDIWVNEYALKRPQTFERGDWAAKWKIPVEETGYGYGPEALAAFLNPPIDELWRYHREVHVESLAYLNTLKPDDFAYTPPSDHPRRRGRTIGWVWSHLLCEIGQHLGHITYLRGLQRGINQ